MKNWKIIRSKYVLKNNILCVRRDDYKMTDGRIAKDYYVIEKSDYCIIAAFTHAPRGRTADRKLIMVKQYRHPIGRIDLEFPAGFARKNETMTQAAARELLEETGYKTVSLKKLGEFYASPGVLTNKAHIFIGRGAIKTSKQKLDPHEQIRVQLLTLAKARLLAKKGKIKDMGTCLSLELLRNNLNNHQR
ncbi:NUDIX hydrolase [Candidatus Peregrinibacteria bacterium]|nr:NUDIX hydrolase [Candidatus Peregrinibacteria bacterium]